MLYLIKRWSTFHKKQCRLKNGLKFNSWILLYYSQGYFVNVAAWHTAWGGGLSVNPDVVKIIYIMIISIFIKTHSQHMKSCNPQINVLKITYFLYLSCRMSFNDLFTNRWWQLAFHWHNIEAATEDSILCV